jgi:hypothetical protein
LATELATLASHATPLVIIVNDVYAIGALRKLRARRKGVTYVQLYPQSLTALTSFFMARHPTLPKALVVDVVTRYKGDLRQTALALAPHPHVDTIRNTPADVRYDVGCLSEERSNVWQILDALLGVKGVYFPRPVLAQRDAVRQTLLARRARERLLAPHADFLMTQVPLFYVDTTEHLDTLAQCADAIAEASCARELRDESGETIDDDASASHKHFLMLEYVPALLHRAQRITQAAPVKLSYKSPLGKRARLDTVTLALENAELAALGSALRSRRRVVDDDDATTNAQRAAAVSRTARARIARHRDVLDYACALTNTPMPPVGQLHSLDAQLAALRTFTD